jgi:hypothetical protein
MIPDNPSAICTPSVLTHRSSDAIKEALELENTTVRKMSVIHTQSDELKLIDLLHGEGIWARVTIPANVKQGQHQDIRQLFCCPQQSNSPELNWPVMSGS